MKSAADRKAYYKAWHAAHPGYNKRWRMPETPHPGRGHWRPPSSKYGPSSDKKAYLRAWRAEHPDYNRKNRGLPNPPYPAPKCCEACGSEFRKTPHLDHCHATGAFRGWLCGNCNKALGLAGDSIDAVRKLLQYLERAYKREQN